MIKLFESTQNTRPILPDSLRFIRSDVPTAVSEAEEQWLRAHDILTIIDLREPQERAQKTCPLGEKNGFTYLCLPVTGGNDIPSSQAEVAASYIRMVDEQMERVIEAAMTEKSNVLYFCNAGKDRTGVVSAILLTRLGYDREYIVADYMKSAENFIVENVHEDDIESAENLRGTLEAFVKNRPDVDLNVITPQPAYMQDFLTWLHHNATK